MIRLKVFAGPCDVQAYAARARKIGLTVKTEGTEHIYVDIPDIPEGAEAARHNAAVDAGRRGDHVLSSALARAPVVLHLREAVTDMRPLPTRIVVEVQPLYATAPRPGDEYDVVFHRADGWSLAAPGRFRDDAEKLWDWESVEECPGTVVPA